MGVGVGGGGESLSFKKCCTVQYLVGLLASCWTIRPTLKAKRNENNINKRERRREG